MAFDVNPGRDAIADAIMAQSIADFAPTSGFTASPFAGNTQMALSQLSDPDTAISDESMGPIDPGADKSLGGDKYGPGDEAGDKSDFEGAGKSSFDPGAMTTGFASLTPGASWEGAGFPNATDMFSPSSNALVSDIAEEGPLGTWDFSPTAPPDFDPGAPDPSDPGDFASAAPGAPAGASFTSGFAQGFDMAAAAFGGGDTSGAGADPGGGGGLGAVGGTEGSGSGDTSAGGVG